MYVSVHQTLRAMQLTAFFLTVCCMAVSAGTLSQSNITFSGKDVKLETVFHVVKNQTGYYFIYNKDVKDVISKASAITVNAKNIPLEEFMEMILKGQDLEWVLQKTTIIIQKKKEEQKEEKKIEEKPTPVTGTIRGPDGQPLAGVNVMIKGTKRGTITDNQGRFKIDADEGNLLEISAIGFEKKEIKVSAQQNVDIALAIATSMLDEVQYIAYGQTSKRLSTSNITSVKAADLEKQPVQNVLLALQARVPGLSVTQVSGLAGAGVKVRIQGQNSIRNGSDPLYVIDGVPIDADLPSTGIDAPIAYLGPNYIPGGNPLNFLNPLDIESVDVLKDADATAIYGSRAASGAILITTKKGRAGAMKLDVNIQTGWGRMTRRLDMMNTRQYLDMRYEAFRNDNIDWRRPGIAANDLKVWDTTGYTNWQDELLGGTAHYNNINATVSGGSSSIRYLVSATYHKENTIFPFPEFADQKSAVHFNLNANNNNQKLKMQFSGNFMMDDNRLPSFDLTQPALLLEPNAPSLLNADGSINWAPDASGNTTLGQEDVNVMIYRLRKYENKTYSLISSLKLDYTILPGFTIGSNFGYNYMQTNDFLPFPMLAAAPERRATGQRSAMFGERNINGWIIEPQANYRTKISKGSLEVIAGSSFQERSATSTFLNATGQLSDELLDDISAATKVDKPTGSFSWYKYAAIFSRVSYNWSDKYILNINARRDGSSRFGANNRFHGFGSVAGAWIFSSEKFSERFNQLISFGKLRGSYGTTGLDQIGDYRFMSLYNVRSASNPYQGIGGLGPEGLPNPNLQWEATRKLQVGIDLGMFKDKLMVNATFVRNRSSNQLLVYVLPAQTGYTIGGTYLVNFPATVQNKNWELEVTGKLIQQPQFTWTSSINLTIPQNKLVAFPDLSSSSYARTLRIGEPIDVINVYHWLGVAPGTGDNLYADNKGNPTLTPNPAEDGTVLISQYPKLYGGFNNTISYKGFQLNFLVQFQQQMGDNYASFFNGNRYPGMFQAGTSNQPVTVLNRWQKPGDSDKSVARYSTKEVRDIIGSDRRALDIWYARLKNVALSWDLPQQWLARAHVRSLRVYVHGQNLLTVTNYKGLDPETQSLQALPPLQVTTIGIQLGL